MPRQPKDTGKRKSDRHKPGRQCRIRSVFLSAADKLAERNGTSFPEEVNRALREYLQREGLWPTS